MSYHVTGPLAVVRVNGADLYLSRGVVLPEGAENVDHLMAVGLVAEVADSSDGETGQAPIAAAESPYSNLSKPELLAEVQKRNTSRDDEHKLDTKGNKPDLIATLTADDANPSGVVEGAQGDGSGE